MHSEPTYTEAVAEEIQLLNWTIVEAMEHHEAAKVAALAKGKLASLASLRVVYQAQGRRMSLRGIAPIKAKPVRTKVKADEMLPPLQAEAESSLAAELHHTPKPAVLFQAETLTVANAEVQETQPLLTETSTPPAPKLNRWQRRALERQQKKAKRRAA